MGQDKSRRSDKNFIDNKKKEMNLGSIEFDNQLDSWRKRAKNLD